MENGHGNRNGFMDGLIKTSSSLQRDVFGFGLKMPPIESSSSSSQPFKRNTPTVLPPPPPPHQPVASSFSSRFTVFNGDDEGGGGGGPNFSNTSYQVSSSLSNDIYYVAAAGLGDSVSASATTFLPFTTLLDPTAFKTTTSGEVGMSTLFGKASVFTASQRQELEKQTIICKYMMASLPVPPQLLSSLSKNQFPGLLHHSTSAAAAEETGLELRFSNRSDTEPWRCRRTDGKKWRCSKNVTHGQKYCERHAHKSRPRSRKPVELIQPKIVPNDSSYCYTNNFPINNHPISHLPSMASRDPTRGTELPSEEQANGTGTMSLWARYQQWQQQHQMHSSPVPSPTTMELNQHSNSRTGEKMQTRGFIDAWSTAAAADKRGVVMKKIGKKECRKIPAVSSLTLSIPGEIEDEEDLDQEQGGNRNVAGRWMNGGICGGGTLGGPLGEALCLGIASNTKWPMPSPPPHKGYRISNNNNNNSISTTTTTSTTSGCSRSSCEDPSSW